MLTINFVDIAMLPIMAFTGKAILEFAKLISKANSCVWDISR